MLIYVYRDTFLLLKSDFFSPTYIYILVSSYLYKSLSPSVSHFVLWSLSLYIYIYMYPYSLSFIWKQNLIAIFQFTFFLELPFIKHGFVFYMFLNLYFLKHIFLSLSFCAVNFLSYFKDNKTRWLPVSIKVTTMVNSGIFKMVSLI